MIRCAGSFSRTLFNNLVTCFLDAQFSSISLFEIFGCLHLRESAPYDSDSLGLYGQANKRIWWMPRRQKAMKDVVACEKLRGAGKQASIRRCPNGETHCISSIPV
jgi:hypothetical protein